MAAGDIIFEDGTIVSQADLDKLLPLILEKLNSTAKDPGQYPVLDRLEGVTSIPCFNASYDLVRVLVSQLKGNTGSTPDITFNVTSLPYGSTPTVDKAGTAENPTISIGLPKGKDGEKIVWRKTATGIEVKYEEEPDSSYKTLFTFFEVMPDVTDFSKEGIALLQRPAIEAATDARNTMTTIQSEADAAIQSATDAAEVAQTAAENVQDGKTPVIEIGTVENGSTAAATLTPAGTDESGNPKSALNLVLPKGKDGEPPVVNYSVLTGQPGTEVQVSQEEAGFTPEGNPIYNVTLTIPRGERGLPGLGSGNVYVDGTGLLAGEKYLFVPSATDSTEGTFVKYEDAPADGKTYGRKDGKWSEVKVENILDISWLMNIISNSEPFIISQSQLQLIIDAYNNNISAALVNDESGSFITPIYIAKLDQSRYNIVIQLGSATTEEVNVGSYNFNIDGDSLTFKFDANIANLITSGDGYSFLSNNGEYRSLGKLVQEAPKDGKIYGRKDGTWTEVNTAPQTETLKITVTSNQAQPDADLRGAVITVSYLDNVKTLTWEGAELTVDVLANVQYTVSCSTIEGYSTPATRTYNSIAGDTRTLSLAYNTTITTINVTSNQSPSDFATAVTVDLFNGFTKTLTGALTYTVKIPTGTSYRIKGAYVGESVSVGFTSPAIKDVIAVGPTQTENLHYLGCKFTVSVVATGSAVIKPNITIIRDEISYAFNDIIPSGSSSSVVVPLNDRNSYVIKGSDAGNYEYSGDITGIIANVASINKTITYTFLDENELSYWVIFDESTPTTTLERGGNEAVRDSIRAKFKRCLAMPQADSKAAIAYLNETDSRYWPDGEITNYSKPTLGIHTMVHFPRYYYRNEDLGNNRYKLYVSEYRLNNNYKEERQCLVGAFEASYVYNVDVTMLSSIYSKNVSSIGNETITTLYDNAQSNGNKWGLIDYRAHKTIANMFCIMYGNTNISTSNSDIPCSGGAKPYNLTTVGATIELGNKDGKVNIDGTDHYSISFLGLEDCYGGKMEFVQGINVLNYYWIVYDGGLSVNKTAEELISEGFTNVRTIGKSISGTGAWITGIKHGEYADIMPITALNGTNTTYYSDTHSSGNSRHAFCRSGYSDMPTAGVFLSFAEYTSSNAALIAGSRLAFYGTIEVKTKDEWLALTPDFNG